MEILAPGVYTMPADEYHADPCPTPSLSASISHLLLQRSPMHARHAHPRLNPDWEPSVSTPEQDEGTALHALILERAEIVAALDFKDWRKAEAKDARAEAIREGRVPILARRWEELKPVAAAVRAQLDQHDEAADAFTAGQPEKVLAWVEETQFGPIWCRARPDWLGLWMDDLKSVEGQHGAEPEAFARAMEKTGRAFTSAFYLRGAKALDLTVRGYRFVAIERNPPHALSVHACAPDLQELGRMQVEAAIHLWGQGLHRNQWPGYAPRIHWAAAPGYVLNTWAQKQPRDRKPRQFNSGTAERVVQSGMPFV